MVHFSNNIDPSKVFLVSGLMFSVLTVSHFLHIYKTCVNIFFRYILLDIILKLFFNTDCQSFNGNNL